MSGLANIGTAAGQTFKACQTGELTSISFRLLAGSVAGTHNLRLSAISPPPTGVSTAPVYQTFSTSGGMEDITIMVSPPFPVVSGNDYVFDIEFGSMLDLTLDDRNDYSDGQAYIFPAGGSFMTDPTRFDMDFNLQISPAGTSTSSGANIPTLGEWGLIILLIALSIIGVVGIKSSQYQLLEN